MLVQCTWCGDGTGEIALMGHMSERTANAVGARDPMNRIDKEAPRMAPISDEPCKDCQARMALGITFIEVRAETFDGTPPDRTGRWWVVKEESCRRFINEPALSSILEKRKAYIERATADAIGLKDENDGSEETS
jgi:hypothetical protein